MAWATFIAQGAASLLSLLTVIIRVRSLPDSGYFPKFSFSLLNQIGCIAIPGILQQSFISVGNILIQRLINNYGSSVIAGYSAAVKLNTFVITSFTTLANGVSGFTAQSYYPIFYPSFSAPWVSGFPGLSGGRRRQGYPSAFMLRVFGRKSWINHLIS